MNSRCTTKSQLLVVSRAFRSSVAERLSYGSRLRLAVLLGLSFLLACSYFVVYAARVHSRRHWRLDRTRAACATDCGFATPFNLSAIGVGANCAVDCQPTLRAHADGVAVKQSVPKTGLLLS